MPVGDRGGHRGRGGPNRGRGGPGRGRGGHGRGRGGPQGCGSGHRRGNRNQTPADYSKWSKSNIKPGQNVQQGQGGSSGAQRGPPTNHSQTDSATDNQSRDRSRSASPASSFVNHRDKPREEASTETNVKPGSPPRQPQGVGDVNQHQAATSQLNSGVTGAHQGANGTGVTNNNANHTNGD